MVPESIRLCSRRLCIRCAAVDRVLQINEPAETALVRPRRFPRTLFCGRTICDQTYSEKTGRGSSSNTRTAAAIGGLVVPGDNAGARRWVCTACLGPQNDPRTGEAVYFVGINPLAEGVCKFCRLFAPQGPRGVREEGWEIV